ncbi:Astacin-like metalloendopeptidase [Strongyloides ratti]|uniref:Metalloendopeptidase n=1 Tax=Strongyloides ratti TaxID=34506 RepID=A0A090LJH6_STRRB|nr:Astacin-like metalloendopeptidase [Strongyloides ratti]CEF69858.1 Astacin-like metalloendopeptidase [Strongyloides ratti]
MLIFIYILLLFVNINAFEDFKNLKRNNTYFSERKKREILKDSKFLWNTKRITYHVNYRLNYTLISKAVSRISRETCLIFEGTKNKLFAMLSYEPGDNFETYLGKRESLLHKISIPPRNMDISKIIRETLRALGMDYETNRSDRDMYVTINRRNIMPKYESKFIQLYKDLTNSYGLPYDYNSIMHLGKYDYSKSNRLPVIETKNKKMEFFMGNKLYLSFNDAKLLNLKYCLKPKVLSLDCQNYGYPDPIVQNRCKCLPFFTGLKCEKFIKNPEFCTNENVLKTDMFVNLKKLILGRRCYFLLFSRPFKKIKLILQFKVWFFFRKCTPKEHIEVRYGKDLSVGGVVYCPSSVPLYIESVTNKIIIASYYEDNFKIEIKYWEVSQKSKSVHF